MSWSRLLPVLLLALALEACGFRPLYGSAGNREVRAELQAVDVALVEGRLGRLLRLDLQQRLSPRGDAAAERYRLEVALEEEIQPLAYRRDGTATIERLVLAGAYRLSGPDGGVLLANRASTVTSYDILDEHFAAIVARRDAEERAVRLLADDIANRLALYFAERAEREEGGER